MLPGLNACRSSRSPAQGAPGKEKAMRARVGNAVWVISRAALVEVEEGRGDDDTCAGAVSGKEMWMWL